MNAKPKLFISRAGADEAFSTEIARVLEADGYELVLQQRDFANKNFLDEMDKALASGVRVVGLLSYEYLTNKNCRAEWLNALHGDPLNEKGRLILLRVTDCEPAGLLSGIAYWDLFPVRDNAAVVADIVRNAVKEGSRRDLTPVAGSYWRAPRTTIDADAVRETASFTGRKAELGAVEVALWKGCGVAAIHGLPGVGKSVLAREYARQNAGRYAVVWRLHAQTETGVIDGLLRLGARFSPELENVQDRRAAAFEVITTVLNRFDKPMLLVFDNLEVEALLRNWHPQGQAHLLATSRNTGWSRGVAEIGLDSWPVPDAVSYLRRESGRDEANLTAADAQKIADALGSLPLALSHAAAYLKRTKTVTATSYLARIEHHLATVPKGAEYEHAVFATFREAILKAEDEAPGACALLCMASFFASDAIPEEFFHQEFEFATKLLPVLDSVPDPRPVVDLRTALADSAAVDEALGALDSLSLVAFVPETRTFTMHRLVQAAARTLLISETDWAVAAVTAANMAFPLVEYEFWSVCERFLPHALAALANIPDGTASARVARLANQCALYLEARAEYGTAEALQRWALAVGERAFGHDHPAVASHLVNLANILRRRNKTSEVTELYRRALSIDEEHYGPDHPEVATDLNNLATFLSDIGEVPEAEGLLRRALRIDEEHFGAEHPAVSSRLSNLASVMRLKGDVPEAERLGRRALAIAEATLGRNHPAVAIRLNNLAVYLNILNKDIEAEAAIRRALAIDEDNYGAVHPAVATRLRNLADVLRKDGRAESELLLRRALSIDEAIYGSRHPSIKLDLKALATILRSKGLLDDARSIDQRAIAMENSSDSPLES